MPDSVAVAVVDSIPADRIPSPGAKRSRHDPQLENHERVSAASVAPTVIALGKSQHPESTLPFVKQQVPAYKRALERLGIAHKE